MADFLVALSYGHKNHAGSKAPSDVVAFLIEKGFNTLPVSALNTIKYLIHPFNLLEARRKVGSGDRVFFQYPCYSHSEMAVMLKIASHCRMVGASTVALVHDLDFLRDFGRVEENLQMEQLGLFDSLIVHSPAMQEALRERGYKGKCAILGLFDYRVRVKANPTYDRNTILFAGNLAKSEFLPLLCGVPFGDLVFNMYGMGQEHLPKTESVRYKGKFTSDDLSSLDGGWGLVWDGDSLEACSGKMGEYLKFNSPHKASLYLCAGLPLIVPAGSAVADLVREKSLGIAVDNLACLPKAIREVDEDRYGKLVENARREGLALMRGEHLAVCLQQSKKEAEK